ncbi:hypothetical protein C6P46_001081 [Rhodotorula mucilaginosa]|uniref:Uncharacterized protein n=1 Tax=Rhodotorula mucilaginosa TaxID=5537 RepID=A0A9P6VVN6_RHOMI|nr:hypothetical protein C6P46_001081 [Rhodotorula mucilaginosa]
MSSLVSGPADVRTGPADLEPPSEARKAFSRHFLGAEEDSVHAQRRLFGFLRNIDVYLQWLTLGITREHRPTDRYWVKLHQRNAQEFASTGVYKEGGINSVTWSLQLLLHPPGGVSSLPEVILFSLTLSYDFRFADCKAAQVGRNAVEYAMMSLQARPKLFQDEALRLSSRNLCSRASSTADTLFSLCLSATNPLILHLSAYNVNSRPADISRYKDGERFWTKVLNPPDTFNQKNNLIVPGPACLKYLQDA